MNNWHAEFNAWFISQETLTTAVEYTQEFIDDVLSDPQIAAELEAAIADLKNTIDVR